MKKNSYRIILLAVLAATVCSVFCGLIASGDKLSANRGELAANEEEVAADTEEMAADTEGVTADTEGVTADTGEAIAGMNENEAAVYTGESKDLLVMLGFDRFPDSYTCEGNDTSPEIQIDGINATSMAMIVDDPDAPVGLYTHWVIWNIPPVSVLPANLPKNITVNEPIAAVQGNNSAGEIGYLGPCPPSGGPHRYFFRVYGLDTMLDIQPGASRQVLEEAMQGHVLQKGEAMATYGR